MKGQTMFNFPRRLFPVDHIRRKANRVRGTKLEGAFKEWLSQHLSIRRIHEGDSGAVQALITIAIDTFRGPPEPVFHENSKAWRVPRDCSGGGTPFYQIHFETKEQAEEWIRERRIR